MTLPIVTLPREPRSGLPRALALSVVVHLLLLWSATPNWSSMATVAPPLLANLRPVLPAQAVDTAAAASASALLGPRASEASERRKTPVREPLQSAASLEPTALPTVASTAIAASRSDSEVLPRIDSSASMPAPPVASSLPTSDGLDPEGLRGYRLALAREARRHKRYPPLAIEAGWSGTVVLRVNVPAGGVSQTAALAQSSGNPVLDTAALEMIRRALPATPVPATLLGQAFEVRLPVLFELPD